MAVNIDADIVNADWTKRTNDLPAVNRREQLVSLIRNIPHWLADLPSATPSYVHSVWHLLTGEEQRIYSERSASEHKLAIPRLRSNGSVVLSLAGNGANSDSAIRVAVLAAFEAAHSAFEDSDDVDDIERKLAGLSDRLLEGLKSDYLPAVIQLFEAATTEAKNALEVARHRTAIDPTLLTDHRSAASTPSSTARRYALSRALRLVEDLSATARTAARDILSRDDLKSSTRVRRLRAVIGMNDRQHDSYMRSLAELASTEQRSVVLGSFGKVEIPDGGLKSAQLQTVADRYAAYLVAQRAQLIDRTEQVTIREETRRATWERLEPSATFAWVTRGASCPECEALDGVEVSAGEDYADGIANPPAHPGCDCTQAVHVG